MTKHIIAELILAIDLACLTVYAYSLFNKVAMLKRTLEREKKIASSMARGNIAMRDQIEQLNERLTAAGLHACDLEPVEPKTPVMRIRP